jgi:hypothetical protein
MKKVEFKVRFDGTTEGFATHRLSLAAFKVVLPRLIDAIQFTAEVAGRQGEIDGADVVKTGQIGKSIDLEIDSISGGSVTLNCILTVMAGAVVPSDLPERTAKTFIGFLQASELPIPSGNAAVSKYLISLPAGVTTQDYQALADGVEFAAYKIETKREVAAPVLPTPRMVTFTATIYGNVYRKTRERVILTTEHGKKYTCRATPEMVNKAVALREDKVTATLLLRPDVGNATVATLVALRAASEPLRVPSVEERNAHLFKKWAGALELLAE